MDENADVWRQYYEKALTRKHKPRTELAVTLNTSNYKTATDCGCGTGSDIHYLSALGYQVSGFDINEDALAICHERFAGEALVEISCDSFECYDYPKNGLVLANSSLYFADPTKFTDSWATLSSSLAIGGVFAGDFMGVNDSWATGYRSTTNPMNKLQVLELFEGFDIIEFHERDEKGRTAIGKVKHWHTFSVVAVKSSCVSAIPLV